MLETENRAVKSDFDESFRMFAPLEKSGSKMKIGTRHEIRFDLSADILEESSLDSEEDAAEFESGVVLASVLIFGVDETGLRLDPPANSEIFEVFPGWLNVRFLFGEQFGGLLLGQLFIFEQGFDQFSIVCEAWIRKEKDDRESLKAEFEESVHEKGKIRRDG